MSTHPLIIIGAGPAGLTAAYEAAKQGQRSLILEADSQVGGLSRTVNYRGFRFDIGGHRFFSKIPYINALWREILDDDFLVRPRLSRIFYDGHFFDYPLKPLNTLAGLGPFEALRVGLSYGKARLFPHETETNFEEWVSNRFGHRLYDIFFKTYTEKVWGIPCREISSDWAAQRIKNLSLEEAIRNALSRNSRGKNGDVITTLIEQFHYPRFGPGMMWEHCEALLAERGNPTIQGARVERVRHRNKRVTGVCTRDPSGVTTAYEGDQFISSMPLRTLLFALDPPPPDAVLEAARKLRYRDYLTVVLIVDRDDVFSDNWIYIHDPNVKMGRIQNYKNWSAEMVPDPRLTSLGLEYFLWQHDEQWRWADQRLIDLGIRECSQIGLIRPADVVDGTVVRMKKAYPIYDQHYHASLQVLREYLATFENLQTIGRNGLHRYNNQDHSMMTGVLAARNVIGEEHDVWAVNTEQAYHEQHDKNGGASGDRLFPTRIAPEEDRPSGSTDEALAGIFARLDPPALGLAVGLVAGLGLFLATAILLVKGGPVVGPNLSLLGHYLLGFEVTWAGAFLGLAEAGLGGFVLGYSAAWLRNRGMYAYLASVRRRVEAEENPDLLEKV